MYRDIKGNKEVLGFHTRLHHQVGPGLPTRRKSQAAISIVIVLVPLSHPLLEKEKSTTIKTEGSFTFVATSLSPETSMLTS